MRTSRSCASALLLAALALPLSAQNAVRKKPLTQADWDRWRSIQNPSLSNNGKWAAYTLSPQAGDGEFVVRSTTGTTEYRIPVGYIGRPNNTPGALRPQQGGGGGGGRFGQGNRPTSPFSADSRFAFVITQPNKEEVERAQGAARAARAAGNQPGAQGGNASNADTTGGQISDPAPAMI